MNLYREATLRFRKKRQPFLKQKGSCIHLRNFYFHTCITPKNTLFRLVGLFEIIEMNSLGGGGGGADWEGGSYCIVYYREYPPPPTHPQIGSCSFCWDACARCTQSLEFLLRDWNMRDDTTQFIELLCIIYWRSELLLMCVCSSWNQVPCINSNMEAEICLQPPRITVYTSLHG